MRRMLILCALAACASGCATMTRGTDEVIAFASEPPGAEVRTSLSHQCTTPCSLRVPRKDAFQAVFTKPGYETVPVYVRQHLGGAGFAAMSGNILIGGIVGANADAQTGAHYDHCPNPVSVRLRPLDRGGHPVGPAHPSPEAACEPKPAAEPAVAAQ